MWKEIRQFFLLIFFSPQPMSVTKLCCGPNLKNETLQLVWGMKEKTVLIHLQKQIKWHRWNVSKCTILPLFYLMHLLITATTANLMLHQNKATFKAFELVLADLWIYLRNFNFERREETRCCKSYKAQAIRLGVGSSFLLVAENKCKIYSMEGYVWHITFPVIFTLYHSLFC